MPPVKLTLRTGLARTRWSPAAPSPCTTLITPGGNPTSNAASANRTVVNGASSLGLITTVLPAASAAPALRPSAASPPFHVMMSATTPYGSGSA